MASADVIAKTLKQHGVPVTLHEPTLYLSIPFTRAGARRRQGDEGEAAGLQPRLPRRR